jgi:hypothetical protein
MGKVFLVVGGAVVVTVGICAITGLWLVGKSAERVGANLFNSVAD